MGLRLDLGNGYSYEFTSWAPDRSIPENAKRYEGVPDVEKYGLILTCPHTTGGVTFDGPVQQAVEPKRPKWPVVQWEPLTLEGSILRDECKCHGFIRAGKWVSA